MSCCCGECPDVHDALEFCLCDRSPATRKAVLTNEEWALYRAKRKTDRQKREVRGLRCCEAPPTDRQQRIAWLKLNPLDRHMVQWARDHLRDSLHRPFVGPKRKYVTIGKFELDHNIFHGVKP